MYDIQLDPIFLIRNFNHAAPGKDRDDAAALLALAPENQPGEGAVLEFPTDDVGALLSFELQPTL